MTAGKELDLINSEQARNRIATRTDALTQVESYERREWVTIAQVADGFGVSRDVIRRAVDRMMAELLRAGLRRALLHEVAKGSANKHGMPWMLNEECALRIGVTLRAEAGVVIRNVLLGVYKAAPVATKKAIGAQNGISFDGTQIALAALAAGGRGIQLLEGGGIEFLRYDEPVAIAVVEAPATWWAAKGLQLVGHTDTQGLNPVYAVDRESHDKWCGCQKKMTWHPESDDPKNDYCGYWVCPTRIDPDEPKNRQTVHGMLRETA